VSTRAPFSSGAAAAASEAKLLTHFIEGEQGRIETITVNPASRDTSQPTLYFLVGWWGAATDYIPTMQYFAGLGFQCRSFSWRGVGQSDGGSFWGFGYEDDLLRVLRHFNDQHVTLIAHSGAADYVRNALPHFRATGRGIESVIFVAPLARAGAMGALLRWLKPDGTPTLTLRWLRFLGSNLFGLSWFMRNKVALHRVLLNERVSDEVVQQVWQQIDRCPWGRYCLSLWRFPEFLRPRRLKVSDYGVKRALVLAAELDRNFSIEQQRDTAQGFDADFAVLRDTCHQWFADPFSFEQTSNYILRWMKAPLADESKDALSLAI
jgi:pimeloyl-ACP methyl ester carboxylesterase